MKVPLHIVSSRAAGDGFFSWAFDAAVVVPGFAAERVRRISS